MPAKSPPTNELTPFAAVNVSQILRHTAALSATAKRFHVHGRLKKATYERIAAKIEAAEQAIRDAVEVWAKE
jgi:hypothetical protein